MQGVDMALDALLSDRLAMLCGAGLSMAPPSNVPSAATLAADAKSKYDKTYGATRPPLPAAIEDQADFFFGRGELATVYLQQYIDFHTFAGPPNDGHTAVADLLLVRGIKVAASTNVDSMIETAGSALLRGQIGVGIDGNAVTADEFRRGLGQAEELATSLHARAVEETRSRRERELAEVALSNSRLELTQRENDARALALRVTEFNKRWKENGLDVGRGLDALLERLASLETEISIAERDLQVIETLRLSDELEKARHDELASIEAERDAEKTLGLANKGLARAQAFHTAARRAGGETLDRRLERVLPLMVELYQRLRPHPVWSNIEYKIRGDVRRFLKPEVGDELNPQFIFSSGQRRATGLAFLLAINLSLTWSRWQTVLLDDPVQHIDDFRSIHLTEVLAQIVETGRQIICSAEDGALADLLCRRLPVREEKFAKRITLGPNQFGASSVTSDTWLQPLAQGALGLSQERGRA
jgi:hypothetical protein